MTSPLPPGTARTAFNTALLAMEAASLRVDEDLIGLPLPEPLDGRAGLVISVFPLIGSRPGHPGMVYPARALARVSLGTGTPMQIIHPLALLSQQADQPLGSPARPGALPPAEDRALRARYMTLLDQTAPQVARPVGADHNLRAEMLTLWRVLLVPILAPSYRLFAPRFHAWLSI